MRDWDKETSNRLNQIAQGQKQDGSDFKTDSSAGDINQGTKGLVDTMKLAEIKKSQNNQPVEQVKEK